jgi:hypothetical protein
MRKCNDGLWSGNTEEVVEAGNFRVKNSVSSGLVGQPKIVGRPEGSDDRRWSDVRSLGNFGLRDELEGKKKNWGKIRGISWMEMVEKMGKS